MRGGYNGECGSDTWQARAWPCARFDNGDFKSYFGRGAKQLSYSYNYGPFSRAMFGDASVLLNNPEKVADSWLNIASAIFFFVYPQPPKPSMLHVVDGTWEPNEQDLGNNLVRGFGVTTQIINGGIECGGTRESQQSQNRIRYFESFANFLGLSLENDFTLNKQCSQMHPFDDKGAGALNIYWEKDWSSDPDNPGNESFACQRVSYQTPFNVLYEGDYERCVEHHFNDIVD